MSSEYYPFDFGSWKDGEGLHCARHGLQYGGPVFAASPRPGETIVRRYCGLCVLDALDRHTTSFENRGVADPVVRP